MPTAAQPLFPSKDDCRAVVWGEPRTTEVNRELRRMAPDVAKKAPKLCKKYTYTEHSKYSQWEKERRARFNDRLEELSRIMPGYSKENPWKKIEIIEQAINNITKRKVEAAKSQEDTISGLAKEVHQLKSIILQFTKIKNVNADVFKLTSAEIGRTLDGLAEQDKENLPPEPPDPEPEEESLAFVAKIARSNDHDYIRTTEETPSLEVEGEVVVETADQDDQLQDEVLAQTAQPPQPLIVDLVAEFEPQPLPSYITFESPSAVVSSLPEAPQLLNLQDIIWPRGMAAVPNVRTVFVNKGSRASLLPTEPMTGTHKLPIPRLKPPKRRSRPKKMRRGTKTKVKTTRKDETIDNVGVNLPLTEVVSETTTKELNESLEALEAVEDALPLDKDDILQNNEEMEILEETIKEQGERETREKSEKDAKKKEGKRGSIVDKDGEKVVVQKKKVDQGKKKSKSSYSIAALCQISVNIGDRPEMANSPGVLSLNSVGTMSPSHTPAPTPTPDPSKTFGMETCGIVIDREENVLEELRTIRPEDVTFDAPGPSGETSMKKTVSPSQNFLTNFPAVSKSDQEDTISVSTKTIQRDIYQALKDLDKELNLEPESLPEAAGGDDIKPDQPKKIPEPIKEAKAVVTTVSTVTVSRYLTSCTTTTEAPPSTTSSALSVYDFSASKPDTPPIPLQKARKQEIRKDEGRVMPAYKSPEKKTYTEMQSKPKKSPVDVGKGKEVVGVAGQNQQYQGMEYQQVQGKQYHQASASYQSRHQVYMGSHYPTYQGMGALQQQHPYHHAPHHPYPPDDMKAGSHHSRYSCASHSYLPAPNYHHYPSTPKHYQGQPGWGQQHYPKLRDRGQPHMEMDAAGNSTPAQASGTTFTVNQLVNSGQRKSSGAKRSSTAGKGGSVAKTGRGEVVKEKEKEDCRKRSGGTRRNKSGGRSTSYSAESLMLPSSSGLVVTADTKEDQAKVKVGPSPSKKENKMETMSGSRAQTTNTWANTGDHFGGLQLSSLSPSPASLFPQDLSSLDFPMPMFGPGEGKEYTLPPSSQTQKTPGKQQAACQRAGTTSVVDWSLNSNILEGGWPLPTITPPGDPMADPMASYNFMSPVPHSHPGFYSCSAPQGAGARQGQGQSYSAHSAANIPVSGYSSSTMVMAKSGTSQPFPPSQVDPFFLLKSFYLPSCRRRRAPWSTSTSPPYFPRSTSQQLDTQPLTVRWPLCANNNIGLTHYKVSSIKKTGWAAVQSLHALECG